MTSNSISTFRAQHPRHSVPVVTDNHATTGTTSHANASAAPLSRPLPFLAVSTVAIANKFIQDVRLAYCPKQPDVFNRFLDLMGKYQNAELDSAGIMFRLAELFRQRPRLLLGLNMFLPPGYRFEVVDESIVVIATLPSEPAATVDWD